MSSVLSDSSTTAGGAATAVPSATPVSPPLRRRDRWFSKTATSFIGIDIGVQEVRVATVRPIDLAANVVAWIGRYRFPLPTRLDQEMTPQSLQSVVSSIPDRLPRCIDGETNIAAISLPIAWTHYQTVVGNEIAETRRRFSKMFADSVFQSPAHVSHWPVVGVHHGLPCGDDQYVVAATAERTSCQIADLVSSTGYVVQSILPHGVVLAHAAKELTGVDAQCVLWLSHASALITVRHQSGVGLSRTLPSVPPRILELDQPDQPLDAHALRPYLTEIATEFKATARYAARADMSRESNKPILIAGPLAELQGVAEIIATLTETPVAVWSFLGKNRPPTMSAYKGETHELIRRLDARYAGALSLAFAAIRGTSKGYGQ